MAQLDWAQVREHSQAVLALDRDNQDALTFIEAAEFALQSSIESPFAQPATLVTRRTPTLSLDQPASFARGRCRRRRPQVGDDRWLKVTVSATIMTHA